MRGLQSKLAVIKGQGRVKLTSSCVPLLEAELCSSREMVVLARLHRFVRVQAKAKYHCSFGTFIIKPRRKPTTRGGKSEYLPKSPDVIYPPYMDLPLVISSQPVPPPACVRRPISSAYVLRKAITSASIMPFATWCCFSTPQTYNAETPIPDLKGPCFPSVSSAEAASEMEVGSTR